MSLADWDTITDTRTGNTLGSFDFPEPLKPSPAQLIGDLERLVVEHATAYQMWRDTGREDHRFTSSVAYNRLHLAREAVMDAIRTGGVR